MKKHIFLILLGLSACKEPTPVLTTISLKEPPVQQASIVSIQSTGPTTAELLVKVTGKPTTVNWQLSGQTGTAQALVVSADASIPTEPFVLIPYRVSGLVAGQEARFSLTFQFGSQETITALRRYTHRPAAANAPNWTRLAHLPTDVGDLTGYPANFGQRGASDFLGIVRYVSEQKMEAWTYSRPVDKWFIDDFSAAGRSLPRKGFLQFNLYFRGVDKHFFYGMGYFVNELAPNKYFYDRNLFGVFPDGASIVLPPYGGEDGEVAFFTTVDEVYFLTQNGSPGMRSINANFPQTVRAPLPEPPGTLATFTVDELGYVVNQRPGQPLRLWQYNPATDTWQRRADFPGTSRSRGAGFSVGNRGFFGLGTDTNQQGLRDIWQYDPATDRWQYVTDYPGQGNRYLAVMSADKRAYLGWGYEAQTTATGAVRQVACTDWWEFLP
ncbi:MAG: hypothetical protein EAZ91_08480 [Cytophagales bacterium]|nr:MAG: hypothetical protein EAZ91_08480 [Cytophagales bacterium]